MLYHRLRVHSDRRINIQCEKNAAFWIVKSRWVYIVINILSRVECCVTIDGVWMGEWIY
jgi:hypothetical protein